MKLESWGLRDGKTSSFGSLAPTLFLLQLQYLNRYYQTIRENVGPELQRRQLLEEFAWLEQHTEPLSARAPHIISWTSLWVASALAILSWSS